MKKYKKHIILGSMGFISLGVLGIAGLLGLGKAYAQSLDDGYPLIIHNLAETFNLDEDEVQKVFKDTMAERVESRLDEFVEDGIITVDQKELIIAKMDEVQVKVQEINEQEMTKKDRMQAMKDLHEEVRAWAEENDIPVETLMKGPMGHKRGMEMKGFIHMGSE